MSSTFQFFKIYLEGAARYTPPSELTHSSTFDRAIVSERVVVNWINVLLNLTYLNL